MCNMRCRYCFYADVTRSRDVANRGMMSPEILETVVERALSETESTCCFAFQGGEPTLAGLHFFRALIDFEKKHNQKNIQILHALQTNGLTLDDAWGEFLCDNAFLVGLSIDAERQIHDSLRRDHADRDTHRRSLDAARLLERHKVNFNILSVLTRRLASHPNKVYNFYKNRGFRHIQFIPCLDDLNNANDDGHDWSLDAKTYGMFLCRVFDLWFQDLVRGEYVSVRTFDNYVHMLAGRPPENCAMAGQCVPYALIEGDGSVYPCDFYALDSYCLGNVRENSFAEMLSGSAAEAFAAPSYEPHPDCLACEYGFICRGGCRRDREPIINGRLSRNKYCDSYRVFFSHALPRLREVARRHFGS